MQGNDSDNKSHMIIEMESKLNAGWFLRRTKKDKLCTITTSQYWDWLTYIDVRSLHFNHFLLMQDDYLTEWEVVKMKELYYRQL